MWKYINRKNAWQEVDKMTQSEIRAAVLEVVKEFPINRVALFGSQADGTATEKSDVDLIMEFYKPVTLLTLSKITQRLEELMQTSVDIIHGPVRNTDMFTVEKEIEIYAA